MKIESITEKDMAKCLEIYNYYIKNSLATLEEDELSREEFSRRVNRITASYPFLVAKEGKRSWVMRTSTFSMQEARIK